MLRRTRWFTVGVVAGASGTVVGYLRARQLARRHVPDSVQDAAARVVRRTDTEVREIAERAGVAIDGWRDTVAETRRTRREAESLLRRQLERAGLY
ncbi:MAG: hypothetical protein KGR18_03170 [Acidobacteria bacterium]|nr:hypothetical protein [Acidobacteriota bacterium]